MGAADGTFDSPIEDVTYSFGAGLPVGQYQICVRGQDVAGNSGEESCSRFVTYDPSAASGVSFQLSNECAQFYTLENEGADNEITTLHYGENIVFDTEFNINTVISISDSDNVNFKFHTQGKGDGYGVMSGIQYQFILNSMLKARTTLDGFDPFTSEFKVKAKIVGQPQELDGYGILNGAQNNAELLFSVRIAYVGGSFQLETFDFSVACAGDPWSNLMENRDLESREPVGRGFGDEMNKYGWTGVDFGDALIVGTKNAFYDIGTYITGGGPPISTCINNPPDPSFPEIYWRFACMEIFGYAPQIRDSNGAQLWRFSYKNKRWQLVYDAKPRHVPEDVSGEYIQGFRDSVVHDGKLYVAADLGAFISGVSYVNTPFTYPGVALLVSVDGINFDIVDTCPTGSGDLCESQTVVPPAVPTNNLSIRPAIRPIGAGCGRRRGAQCKSTRCYDAIRR